MIAEKRQNAAQEQELPAVLPAGMADRQVQADRDAIGRWELSIRGK